MMINQIRWAFWKYDLYPFLLSGKIVQDEKGGLVQVEGYATKGVDGVYRGGAFRPVAIVVGDEGEALAKTLNELREISGARRRALREDLETELLSRVSGTPIYNAARSRVGGDDGPR